MKKNSSFDNVLERVYLLSGYAAAGLIVVMVGLVLANIISRLLDAYIPGLTEIAGYCMAGCGALGLAYTFGRKGHIRVNMIVDRLQGGTRFALDVWSLLVAAGLTTFASYYLVKMVYYSWLFEDRSDGSDAMLIWIAQTPMTLGFVVFSICLLHALAKRVVNTPQAQ